MVHPTGAAAVEIAPRAVVYFSVAVGVGYLLTITEDSSLAGADGHLCTTIAVEVSYGETR